MADSPAFCWSLLTSLSSRDRMQPGQQLGRPEGQQVKVVAHQTILVLSVRRSPSDPQILLRLQIKAKSRVAGDFLSDSSDYLLSAELTLTKRL